MTDIFGPRSQTGHPDRFLDCQEAIEAAFASLAEQAVSAGWGEAEVAAALVDVADYHKLSLNANLETEKIIREAAARSAIKKT
jgi:hypothetical protein